MFSNYITGLNALVALVLYSVVTSTGAWTDKAWFLLRPDADQVPMRFRAGCNVGMFVNSGGRVGGI